MHPSEKPTPHAPSDPSSREAPLDVDVSPADAHEVGPAGEPNVTIDTAKQSNTWAVIHDLISLPAFDFALLWTMVMMLVQLVVTAGVLAVIAIPEILADGRPEQFSEGGLGQFEVALVAVGTLTTLLTALIIVWSLFGRHVPQRIGWRGCAWRQWVLVVLFVVPLAIAGGEFSNLAAEVLPSFNTGVFEELSRMPWMVVFITACLLPGLGEEIFFRGFLSRGLIARHGVIWGSLWASLLFALMHVDPIQVCGTLVLGLGMQYVLITTRSLIASIVVHALNNTLAFAAMRYADVIRIEGVTVEHGQGVTHTPLALLIPALLALVVLTVLLYQTRTRWVLPDGDSWSPGHVGVETPPESTAAAVTARPHAGLMLAAIGMYATLIAAAFWIAGGIGE
jgi:membrane protease YdiL (CAAX protease family)